MRLLVIGIVLLGVVIADHRGNDKREAGPPPCYDPSEPGCGPGWAKRDAAPPGHPPHDSEDQDPPRAKRLCPPGGECGYGLERSPPCHPLDLDCDDTLDKKKPAPVRPRCHPLDLDCGVIWDKREADAGSKRDTEDRPVKRDTPDYYFRCKFNPMDPACYRKREAAAAAATAATTDALPRAIAKRESVDASLLCDTIFDPDCPVDNMKRGAVDRTIAKRESLCFPIFDPDCPYHYTKRGAESRPDKRESARDSRFPTRDCHPWDPKCDQRGGPREDRDASDRPVKRALNTRPPCDPSVDAKCRLYGKRDVEDRPVKRAVCMPGQDCEEGWKDPGRKRDAKSNTPRPCYETDLNCGSSGP